MRGRTFCRKGGILGPIGSREGISVGVGAVAACREVTGGSTSIYSVRLRCVCTESVAETLATPGILLNASFGIGTFVHTCDIRVESRFRFCFAGDNSCALGSGAGAGPGVRGDGKGEGMFRNPSRLRLPPRMIPFCERDEVLPVLLELLRSTGTPTPRPNNKDPATASASRSSCTRSTR